MTPRGCAVRADDRRPVHVALRGLAGPRRATPHGARVDGVWTDRPEARARASWAIPTTGGTRIPRWRSASAAVMRLATRPRRSARLVGVGIFGPWTRRSSCRTLPGMGLSSSIYTRDPQSVWRFRQGISAGMVSVNNSTSGAEAHLPFGGNGKSGNGSRQSGVWVLDQFTRWQSMNWDYSGQLQKAQMDVVDLPSDPEFRLL